ncbi:MAG: hypothetical protein ABH919_02195 [bacterium]
MDIISTDGIYLVLSLLLVIFLPIYIAFKDWGDKIFKDGIAYFTAYFMGIAIALPMLFVFGPNAYSITTWVIAFLIIYFLCTILPGPDCYAGME